MNILLSRIDDRFIHGQFLTRWIPSLNVERIIIVSEEVSKDPLRKKLTLAVAPGNIKCSVVGKEKMLRAYNSDKYIDCDVALLFENPMDVLDLIRQGVKIREVNVGGMRFETGKKQITKSVSVNEQEREAFLKLHDLGILIEMRQLPDDKKIDFIDQLKQK